MSLARKTLIIGMLIGLAANAGAQVKLTVDTLECHVIGFSFGLLSPGYGNTSTGMTGGNVRDLYAGPYLNFGINCDYKYKSNWMVTLDADMWFGSNSDNLKDRYERMGDVFSPEHLALGWGGYDGNMVFYNRNVAARLGLAKMFTLTPKNPNSGVLLKVSGGWVTQKTVFYQDFDQSPVMQMSGDYAKLYDHLRNGIILTESLGGYYMNNLSTYVNFRLTFEISQMWTWSSRPYVIDNVMGLNGPDKNRYFDLIYGVRLTWMFPLMGKTTYDYYYY